MRRDDWFRQTRWSEARAAAFWARLQRCRGDSGKPQYLRIQALTLAESGDSARIRAALTLLDRLFRDYPDDLQVAAAHVLAAECHAHLGDTATAVTEYRRALAAERRRPNVDSGVKLDYPWFIVVRGLSDRYDDALRILKKAHIAFPIQEFKAAAIRALIAESREDADAAAKFAKQALAAAGAKQSGFAYHRMLGLVGRDQKALVARLERLARCRTGGRTAARAGCD